MLKGEVVRVHAMKAYRGIRGIDPLILNLGTRWRSVVRFTSRPFYPPSPTPRPQSRYGRFTEETIQAMYYNVTMRRIRATIVVVEEQ